jgi:hypothetical protein
MKSLHAIFEGGQILFPFDYPDLEGPTEVIVIFPGEDITLLSTCGDDDPWKDDIPW